MCPPPPRHGFGARRRPQLRGGAGEWKNCMRCRTGLDWGGFGWEYSRDGSVACYAAKMVPLGRVGASGCPWRRGPRAGRPARVARARKRRRARHAAQQPLVGARGTAGDWRYPRQQEAAAAAAAASAATPPSAMLAPRPTRQRRQPPPARYWTSHQGQRHSAEAGAAVAPVLQPEPSAPLSFGDPCGGSCGFPAGSSPRCRPLSTMHSVQWYVSNPRRPSSLFSRRIAHFSCLHRSQERRGGCARPSRLAAACLRDCTVDGDQPLSTHTAADWLRENDSRGPRCVHGV